MPLLFFVAALVVIGLVVAGVASGATTTTLEAAVSIPAAGPQTESYQTSASDLGVSGRDAPAITSPAVIVETMDTGKVLYERNADERRPMASTTKIMTAMLVLQSGVDLSAPVKVSAKAANTWETSTWVRAGDVVTVEELLYALLLRSANGAAVALAENDAGSVSAFVDKMNQEAAKLGMKDTHFVTVNGLDADGHYSTAADLALLARYAMKDEKFRSLVDTKKHTLSIEGRKSLVLSNTNRLLQQYDWVMGVKTGSTPKADHCLVSAGTKDGREVVAVVLGQPDADVCFEESRKLLQYGLDSFRPVKLVNEGAALAEADVPYHMDGKVELITNGALEAEVGPDEVITTKVVVDRPLVLPVSAGETFGHVVATKGSEELGRVALVAAKSFTTPTLGSKLAYLFRRLGSALGIG